VFRMNEPCVVMFCVWMNLLCSVCYVQFIQGIPVQVPVQVAVQVYNKFIHVYDKFSDCGPVYSGLRQGSMTCFITKLDRNMYQNLGRNMYQNLYSTIISIWTATLPQSGHQHHIHNIHKFHIHNIHNFHILDYNIEHTT
jgi:hypothetical protein